MITKVVGKYATNAGVEFFSTPDGNEADECAIFDEERQVWHWCDTGNQTELQRMIALMARKTELETCGKTVSIRSQADYRSALSSCLYSNTIPLTEREVANCVEYLWLGSSTTPNGARHYETKVQAKAGSTHMGYIILDDDRVVRVYPVRVQFDDGAGTMYLFFHDPSKKPEDMGKPDPRYAGIEFA